MINASLANSLEELYLQSVLINANDENLYSNPNDIVIGNKNGDITIVEFFDYNCGYCKQALSDINILISNDKNLRVILKDYPILNENSYDLAKLSIAAGMQGKYFEFHNNILNQKGRVSYQGALDIASDIGLDRAMLEEDFNGKHVKDVIANNKVLGYSLAVSGTPAYFIGDIRVPGAVGYERLEEFIAFARKNGMNSFSNYVTDLSRIGDQEAQQLMDRYSLD
tara:strand:+ start:478 stop:1149 length:672 start_codon:yes stop_codon:yes gene_type:complete